ncbi:hypothetical protein ACJBXR_11390, partial [Streptococcus suis]
MKINQMKKDEFFEVFYLIKTAEVRQTRAGKDYLALTFQEDAYFSIQSNYTRYLWLTNQIDKGIEVVTACIEEFKSIYP